jgi:hypothetical protein
VSPGPNIKTSSTTPCPETPLESTSSLRSPSSYNTFPVSSSYVPCYYSSSLLSSEAPITSRFFVALPRLAYVVTSPGCSPTVYI